MGGMAALGGIVGPAEAVEHSGILQAVAGSSRQWQAVNVEDVERPGILQGGRQQQAVSMEWSVLVYCRQAGSSRQWQAVSVDDVERSAVLKDCRQRGRQAGRQRGRQAAERPTLGQTGLQKPRRAGSGRCLGGQDQGGLGGQASCERHRTGGIALGPMHNPAHGYLVSSLCLLATRPKFCTTHFHNPSPSGSSASGRRCKGPSRQRLMCGQSSVAHATAPVTHTSPHTGLGGGKAEVAEVGGLDLLCAFLLAFLG